MMASRWLQDLTGLEESALIAALAGIAGVAATGLIARAVGRGEPVKRPDDGSEQGPLRSGEEEGVVYVYVYGPWAHAPSSSGFCLKLMTWLRLANVPKYELRETMTGAKSTSKLPYIRYNGRTVADSQRAINFLAHELQSKVKDLDATVRGNAERAARAHAAQRMLEDGTYFAIVYDRWVTNRREFVHEVVNGFGAEASPLLRALGPVGLRYVVAPSVESGLRAQGIALRPPEEISQIFEQDVAAVSAFLASSGNFLGGSQPCVADCTAFAMLASVLYAPFPRFKHIVEKHENLVPYMQRMRHMAFPDWEELCRR